MTVLARAEVILEGNDRPLSRALNRAEGKMSASGAAMQRIATRAGQASAVAIAAIGVASVKAAVTMERLELSLGVTAGSAEEAAKQMEDLERIARLPGLGFREAIEGANQLNVAFSDLPNATGRSTRTLEAFGRAVALTGGGRAELQRVITQVTQIASAGKLLQQDLRPIIQTAPAVGQALKNAFGTISPQEIESLGLSTTEFMDELVSALEALPAPAETTANAFENLGDATFRAGAAFGELALPTVSAGINALASGLENAADEMERISDSASDPNVVSFAGRFGEPGVDLRRQDRLDVRDIAAGLDAESIRGRQAGGATQFLPERADVVGVQGGAEREAEMRATTQALREQAAAFAEAEFEAEQLDLRIELLNEKARQLNASMVEGGETALPEWARSLEAADVSALDLERATGVLNIELDEEAIKANQAAVAILALKRAQDEAADSASELASKLGAGLGVISGLVGAFGIAAPFLGPASSLLGAFTSSLPFFAHGGRLDAGMFGIAGEAGLEVVGRPTLIKGPAEIAPISGGGGGSIADRVEVSFPPARSVTDHVRDPLIARAFIKSLREAEANGWTPA